MIWSFFHWPEMVHSLHESKFFSPFHFQLSFQILHSSFRNHSTLEQLVASISERYALFNINNWILKWKYFYQDPPFSMFVDYILHTQCSGMWIPGASTTISAVAWLWLLYMLKYWLLSTNGRQNWHCPQVTTLVFLEHLELWNHF